jgi:hypothetical protein
VLQLTRPCNDSLGGGCSSPGSMPLLAPSSRTTACPHVVVPNRAAARPPYCTIGPTCHYPRDVAPSTGSRVDLWGMEVKREGGRQGGRGERGDRKSKTCVGLVLVGCGHVRSPLNGCFQSDGSTMMM